MISARIRCETGNTVDFLVQLCSAINLIESELGRNEMQSRSSISGAWNLKCNLINCIIHQSSSLFELLLSDRNTAGKGDESVKKSFEALNSRSHLIPSFAVKIEKKARGLHSAAASCRRICAHFSCFCKIVALS